MIFKDAERKLIELQQRASLLEFCCSMCEEKDLAGMIKEADDLFGEIKDIRCRIANSKKSSYIEGLDINELEENSALLHKKISILSITCKREDINTKIKQSLLKYLDKFTKSKIIIDNRLYEWYNTQQI